MVRNLRWSETPVRSNRSRAERMSDHASGFPGGVRSAPVSRGRPAASRPRRFLQGLVFALLLEALVALPGCAGPERNFWVAEAGGAAHRVYVVQRGWHTGIAVRQAEIAPGLWPEQADFPEGGYLEAGWG
ncbi:MAG: uncharacterized protein H6R26_768, partial [Proteobacteria bacterium]|nr:uncharacterized protein [Pseudomonadota bacterium]